MGGFREMERMGGLNRGQLSMFDCSDISSGQEEKDPYIRHGLMQAYLDSLKDIDGITYWQETHTALKLPFVPGDKVFSAYDAKLGINNPPSILDGPTHISPNSSEYIGLGSFIGGDTHIGILPMLKGRISVAENLDMGSSHSSGADRWACIALPPLSLATDVYEMMAFLGKRGYKGTSVQSEASSFKYFQDLSEADQSSLLTKDPNSPYSNGDVHIRIPLMGGDGIEQSCSSSLDYLILKQARIDNVDMQRMLQTLSLLGILSFHKAAYYKMLKQVIVAPENI